MEKFAIVVREYKKGKDYRMSHIKDATHLVVYIPGKTEKPAIYPMSDLDKLESGQRGPGMKKYLEMILKQYNVKSIDVLATVTPIKVDGPWKKNDVYKENSDALGVAEKYLKKMKEELYRGSDI